MLWWAEARNWISIEVKVLICHILWTFMYTVGYFGEFLIWSLSYILLRLKQGVTRTGSCSTLCQRKMKVINHLNPLCWLSLQRWPRLWHKQTNPQIKKVTFCVFYSTCILSLSLNIGGLPRTERGDSLMCSERLTTLQDRKRPLIWVHYSLALTSLYGNMYMFTRRTSFYLKLIISFP